MESYSGHRDQPYFGMLDHTPFIGEMFGRTFAETGLLTPEKLRALLMRFQGKSVQLPAHEGTDGSVYGSLAVYREEVCEELADWQRANGWDALEAVFSEAAERERDPEVRALLQDAMEKIRSSVS